MTGILPTSILVGIFQTTQDTTRNPTSLTSLMMVPKRRLKTDFIIAIFMSRQVA